MREAPASIFRFISKLVSVFFAILFVFSTSIVLLLFNVERTLLNARTYKNALGENGVYKQLPALAEGEIDTMKTFLKNRAGIAKTNMDFMNNLTTEDWQKLLNLVLPPEDAREMVESMLDQVFASINGQTDAAHLSLVVLKAHLTGQAGMESIQYLLNTQPRCTEKQVLQIHSENTGVKGQLVYCNPPHQDLDLLTSQWQATLDAAAAGIPDQVIIEPPFKVFIEGLLGKNPTARLNTLRMITEFSPILPFFLLLLLTLFAVRSLKGWLLWWGIPLFISGLIVTAIGLATLPLLNSLWVNYIFPQLSSAFSTGVTSLARNLIVSVGRILATQIYFVAVIIGLLGWVAIISSFFVDARLKEPMP
jgi:hypothetical protein